MTDKSIIAILIDTPSLPRSIETDLMTYLEWIDIKYPPEHVQIFAFGEQAEIDLILDRVGRKYNANCKIYKLARDAEYNHTTNSMELIPEQQLKENRSREILAKIEPVWKDLSAAEKERVNKWIEKNIEVKAESLAIYSKCLVDEFKKTAAGEIPEYSPNDVAEGISESMTSFRCSLCQEWVAFENPEKYSVEILQHVLGYHLYEIIPPGFIITEDLISENTNKYKGFRSASCPQTINCINAKDYLEVEFRLLDDDDIVYFRGRMSKVTDSFAPLDTFGHLFGCTSIEIFENEEWKRV
jgi:hypothetical protein